MEEQVAKRDFKSQGNTVTNLHENENTGDMQMKKMLKLEVLDKNGDQSRHMSMKKDTISKESCKKKGNITSCRQTSEHKRKGDVNVNETNKDGAEVPKSDGKRSDESCNTVSKEKGNDRNDSGLNIQGQGHETDRDEVRDEKEHKGQCHSNSDTKEQNPDKDLDMQGHIDAYKGQSHDSKGFGDDKEKEESNHNNADSESNNTCKDGKQADFHKVGKKDVLCFFYSNFKFQSLLNIEDACMLNLSVDVGFVLYFNSVSRKLTLCSWNELVV